MRRVETPDEFNAAVLETGGPVLTLFFAAWCSFCRTFLPIFQEADTGKAKKVAVEITEETNPLWDTYLIQVVPTLILFAEGSILGRADGVLGKGLSKADLGGLLVGAGEA